MRSLFASSSRLLDGLKFGLLPALAIEMMVGLVLEFGIRLLDRLNGPVLMIPFCRSTKEAERVLARGYKLAFGGGLSRTLAVLSLVL